MTNAAEIEVRFVFLDEDGTVYGPLSGPEVRAWILDDLMSADSTAREMAEYRAMDDSALLLEYTDTTGTRFEPMTEPTAEWREQVKEGAR